VVPWLDLYQNAASSLSAVTTVRDMEQARERKDAVLCLKFGNGVDQLKSLTRALREIDTSVWAVTSMHLTAEVQNWNKYPQELSDLFRAIGDIDSVSRLQIEETHPFTALPLPPVAALLRKMRLRLEALHLRLSNLLERTADLLELEEAIEELSCLASFRLTAKASPFLEDYCKSDSSPAQSSTDAAWAGVKEVWDEPSAQEMDFTCDLWGGITLTSDATLLPMLTGMLSFSSNNCGSSMGRDSWPFVLERVSPFGTFPANFAISRL
jgi:hypothetical protein